ncbi:MAG TPA: hypothetical protein VIL48_17855 [Acidimicrobiales bacterium]
MNAPLVLALGASDCEALRGGWLGQPANALSSLAYVAAGAFLLRRGAPTGPALAVAAAGVGSLLYHGPMPPGAELAHDGSLIALAGVGLVVAWRRRRLPRPPARALAAFGSAVVVNALTRTGAPLCRPEAVLQGHAVWHALTAVALAAWFVRWAPARPDAEPEPELAAPS